MTILKMRSTRVPILGRISCGSDVEYLLRINHAGRKFITGEGDDRDRGTTTMTTTTTTTTTTITTTIASRRHHIE